MVPKPTYDDVNLILRLYEARREDKLRTAREWFAQNFRFHTMEEYNRGCPPGSSMNAYARMVMSYWDMVASASLTRASPKSSSFTPAFVTRTLPGFRSRCVTLFLCAASSASQICAAYFKV